MHSLDSMLMAHEPRPKHLRPREASDQRADPWRCKPLTRRIFPHIGESARLCKICGAKQKRTIEVYGPIPVFEYKKYLCGEPHRSHKWYFSGFILTRWLISPPDPVPHDGWYLVIEVCTCEDCVARKKQAGPRITKVYRRPFGRFDFLVSFRLKRRCPGLFRLERFSVKSFDEFKKKYGNMALPSYS